ncbi:MAG: hypothetical protein QM750_09860 [Rubrivivax sp.]
MSSRSMLWILLLGAGLAAWAWWPRVQPALRGWLPAAVTAAPMPSAIPKTSAAPLRKCRRGAELLYTNGDCPRGSREEAVDGGSLSVLPAAPAPAPAPASAAGAQSPLRRLAGDGAVPPEAQERLVEKALQR